MDPSFLLLGNLLNQLNTDKISIIVEYGNYGSKEVITIYKNDNQFDVRNSQGEGTSTDYNGVFTVVSGMINEYQGFIVEINTYSDDDPVGSYTEEDWEDGQMEIDDCIKMGNDDNYMDPENMDDFPQCSICFEGIGKGHGKKSFDCEHTFHETCINKWLTRGNNTCPNCRTPFCNYTTFFGKKRCKFASDLKYLQGLKYCV